MREYLIPLVVYAAALCGIFAGHAAEVKASAAAMLSHSDLKREVVSWIAFSVPSCAQFLGLVLAGLGAEGGLLVFMLATVASVIAVPASILETLIIGRGAKNRGLGAEFRPVVAFFWAVNGLWVLLLAMGLRAWASGLRHIAGH
jgi:hypothetical protein